MFVRGLEGAEDAGLTLSGAIAEVKEKNPSLSSARWRLGLLEADVAVNSAFPNPSLEIEKSASGDTEDYEVKASQPVPLTRRTHAARSAALADFEAGKKELEALETVILGEARKAWYGLRISQERRRFEETNLRFSM
ncbi:MAG TPA: TolC family protein, partial [Elusimicrobiota bacterium]|nr:TolC family protein [Elusimicrobiota bacterium]